MAGKRHDMTGPFIFLGRMVCMSLLALLRILWFFFRGILRMFRYVLAQCGRAVRFAVRAVKHAFAEHNRPAEVLLQDVRRARGRDREQFRHQVLRFFGMYLFGEHGFLRTSFNYVLPVISVVFLIGVVHYGLGMEYALSIVCNGEEIGIVNSESEFEQAEAEVRQRVANAGQEVKLDFHPVYSLRIVADDDQYLSAHTIADRLLAGSRAELSEAYGVYVDGEFVGAVQDTDAVSEYMDDALNEYARGLDSLVNEVYYAKKITYQEGLYLAESVKDTDEMIKFLTKETQQESRYAVKENDTPQLIAAKYNMTTDALHKLNPGMQEDLKTGTLLRVTTLSRYIPIAYTRTLTLTSYIGYGSVRVETSALNLGVEEVLSRGVIGERTSEVLVTYMDGAESSREVLKTAVTRQPVPEQIGVGTYTAKPSSSSTVFTGTGKYGWPVNGGYVSDGFISDRNHKGIDIAAPMGTEIYAADGGTVVAAGWNSGGYGNYVIIEHEDGYRTLYGHCSRVVCYEGQTVKRGQLIANVGSTGDSSGPHCHFEVRINNIPVNPGNYLRVNVGS